MTDDNPALDPWPFARQDPTCIVLGPRAGHEPSSKPPVRIFLGTEEAQYRAERVFFFSIEKVRDPSRVYEIHLMKNVRGFDRSKWRTGFTNYRYAIPSFAGGDGRAIYNDVDQIYLADPALLFDTDMGGHGYMAISAKDTSVMVMDCAKMVNVWNRDTAARLSKHELIAKPSSQKGLWGQLDGHWNARDQEYVEGRSMCLHYTALHQQPWEPFPDDYSYHPNPLAYIWHDLENEADAADYQLFSALSPSPDFEPIVAVLGSEGSDLQPSDMANDIIQELAIKDAKTAHTRHGLSDVVLPDGIALGSLVVDTQTKWSADQADMIVINGLLGDLPPADLPWVLDGVFNAARKLVYIQIGRTLAAGMDSLDWWERRIRETAQKHPGISWQIDAVDGSADLPGTITSIQCTPSAIQKPKVWALATGNDSIDKGMVAIAERLSGELIEIRPGQKVPSGAPDLVLSADQSGGKRALEMVSALSVQFGHSGLPVSAFDLVISTPDERIPIRPNVLHIPVSAIQPPEPEKGGALLVVAMPTSLDKLDKTALLAIAKSNAKGLRLWIEQGMPSSFRRQLLDIDGIEDVSEHPLEALVAGASRLMISSDQKTLIDIAARSACEIELAPVISFEQSFPAGKMLGNVARLLMGGGTSYRGTPHQQHFVARSIDKRVIEKGWRLPRDFSRSNRALVGRGLAQWSGQTEPVATPKPLDCMDKIERRLKALLAHRSKRLSTRR